MKKSNDFLVLRRQSRSVILVALVKYFQIVFRQAIWPLLILLVFGRGTDTFTQAIIALSIFAGVFSILGAVIKYLYFYYCFRDGHLKVTEGLLRKRNLSVPREKIQRVEFEQNVIHRLLKVVTVRIETAGAEGEELEVGALEIEEAEALRKLLLEGRSEGTRQVEMVEGDILSPQPIFRLSLINLIRAGLVRNHLRTFGIVLGFFASIYFQFEDVIDMDKWLAAWLPQWYYSDERTWGFLIMLPPLIVLVISITLIRTIIQFYNFGMWRTGEGFRVTYGLFNRYTNSALNRKVQFLKWRDNILMRLLEMYSMNIFQASSVSAKRDQSIQIPFCFKPQIDIVREDVYPEFDKTSRDTWLPSLRYRYLIFFRFGVLPSLLLVGMGILRQEFAVWVGLTVIWLLLMWLFADRYTRTMKLEMDEEHLFIEQGVLEKDRWLLKVNRLQGMALHQNPFEQRRHLASIELFTAAGSVFFPYLPYSDAAQLRDYILYKVETNKASWM